MTSMFRQILETALFPLDMTGGLVLAAELDPGSEQGDHTDSALHVPRDLFPETCRVHKLSGGMAFVHALMDILSATSPNRLFVLPPMAASRSLPEEVRDQYPGLNLEEIVLLVLNDTLAPGSLVGVLLPSAFFSEERRRDFRERLFGEAAPRLLVTHDHPWPELGVHPAFRVNTLIMQVGKPDLPQSEQLQRFFKCPPSDDSKEQAEIISDLQRLLRQTGGRTKYGYVLRNRLPPGAPLRHDLYHPELVSREQDLAHFGEVRPLSELVELLTGLRATAEGVEMLKYENGQGVPVIEGRQISIDGHIALEELRYRASAPAHCLLKAGDICLRRIWGNAPRLNVAQLDASILPVVAHDSVIVLRPKAATSSEQVELMLAYLRSTVAAESVRARSTGPSLRPEVLLNLPVPVPDLPLTLAIRSLNEAAAQFGIWKGQAEESRNRLFHTGSAVARERILSVGRLARRRCEAAALVEDFRHRIRTQFPHPIAYRWRTVESSRPDLEGYEHLLACAEVTLCYLACVAAALSQVIDRKISWIHEMAKRMSGSSPRGTNMGDWLAILREVRTSRQFRTMSDAVPFPEVVHLLEDEEADQAFQRLAIRRNDHSHGKGPQRYEIESAYAESLPDLEIVLRHTEFLCEYRLRYVESTRRDSMRKITHYEYRDLMGDHALAPLARSVVEESELEARSLYLLDRSGILHLLRPLLTRRECPVCGSPSTFYLDNWSREGDRCLLKSMEHNHVVEDEEIAAAFRHIGLLLPAAPG